MTIVISSGHGKYVRGASGIIDEVDEARRVVETVATCLNGMGVDTITYHDDVSITQDENLNRIVDFHNSKTRDLDISVHFNAYEPSAQPRGTEVLYLSQKQLAKDISAAIASVGFINRGAKYRDDLFFLNNTSAIAVLIEVCFVDSEADCAIYKERFLDICLHIASAIDHEPVFASGKVSWFGGPLDTGVSPDEGLAFIYDVEDAPHLFLPYQPAGTSGLARRLDPAVHYIACRWDYNQHPKDILLEKMALVRSPKTGREFPAYPADWGPHADTERVADISSGLMEALGIETDDEVEVIFPYEPL
jgi:N-acetylmuramoyl-L-alanine amidase